MALPFCSGRSLLSHRRWEGRPELLCLCDGDLVLLGQADSEDGSPKARTEGSLALVICHALGLSMWMFSMTAAWNSHIPSKLSSYT